MAEGDAIPPTTHGKGVQGFLEAETAGLPNWAWILVIAAGIIAAIYVPKLLGTKQQGTATGTDTGTQGLGLAVDPTTGLPYAVSGLVPAGGTVASSPPPIVPTAGPTPLVGQQLVALLRPNVLSGPGAGGTSIPVRSSPSGTANIIGTLPSQSQIEVTGTSITGSNNFNNAPTGVGSTLWYPVAGGGYISAWDIIGFSNISSTPMVTDFSSAWPGGTTQQRLQ